MVILMRHFHLTIGALSNFTCGDLRLASLLVSNKVIKQNHFSTPNWGLRILSLKLTVSVGSFCGHESKFFLLF